MRIGYECCRSRDRYVTSDYDEISTEPRSMDYSTLHCEGGDRRCSTAHLSGSFSRYQLYWFSGCQHPANPGRFAGGHHVFRGDSQGFRLHAILLAPDRIELPGVDDCRSRLDVLRVLSAHLAAAELDFPFH